MDNNELNKAIIKVLTTTFKKDALDAHKALSEAGYTIEKYSGAWHVTNPTTNRSVYIANRTYGGYIIHGAMNNAKGDYKGNTTKLFLFDFVGCLNKPWNVEYSIARRLKYQPTKDKYDRILEAKRHIKYTAACVIEYNKKIAELQNVLKYYKDEYQKAKANLTKVRQEVRG